MDHGCADGVRVGACWWRLGLLVVEPRDIPMVSGFVAWRLAVVGTWGLAEMVVVGSILYGRVGVIADQKWSGGLLVV